MAGASEIKASQASHQSCIFWLAYIGNIKISLTRFVNFLVHLKVAKTKIACISTLANGARDTRSTTTTLVREGFKKRRKKISGIFHKAPDPPPPLVEKK